MNRNYFFLLLLLILLLTSCSREEEVFFSKSDSPHYFSEDMQFGEHQILVFEAGSELVLADSVNVKIKGSLHMIGTEEEPITINPENPGVGWGQISLEGEADHLNLDFVHITDGTFFSFTTENVITNCVFKNAQDLNWESAMIRFIFGEVEVTDNTFIGVNKAEGVLVHDVSLASVQRNNFIDVPDAIEFINCMDSKISGNIITNGADDGIDLNGSIDILIMDNTINGSHDAGIEIGSEGFGETLGTTLINNTIVDCTKGIWLKESSDFHAQVCTFQNNDIAIDVISPSTGTISSAIVESCQMMNNGEDIRKDDRSEVEVID